MLPMAGNLLTLLHHKKSQSAFKILGNFMLRKESLIDWKGFSKGLQGILPQSDYKVVSILTVEIPF